MVPHDFRHSFFSFLHLLHNQVTPVSSDWIPVKETDSKPNSTTSGFGFDPVKEPEEFLEQTSTDQLAIVTVKSLQGYSIEDYGIGLARKWGIGQKGKDNGVLLIVAPNDRKVRIEVGRRLEPFMTDTMSALIIQNAILPKFRRGDYAGGIKDGVRDIKSVLLGDAEEVKRRAAGPRRT